MLLFPYSLLSDYGYKDRHDTNNEINEHNSFISKVVVCYTMYNMMRGRQLYCYDAVDKRL